MSNPAVALGANLGPSQEAKREGRGSDATTGFVREIGALSAFRLESCIHCGICADACHFYIATEDPQYTPIWKVEPFKQAYKREASAFAPLFRLLGLKREVTEEQLAGWQHHRPVAASITIFNPRARPASRHGVGRPVGGAFSRSA